MKKILSTALVCALAFAAQAEDIQYSPIPTGVGAGSVTSVSGGTTGITVANPTSTPTLGGTLVYANGGTSATTQQSAVNNLGVRAFSSGDNPPLPSTSNALPAYVGQVGFDYNSGLVPNIVSGMALNAFDFTVSGITVAPTSGATYTNNGITYTVRSTTFIFAGAGNIVATGSGLPLASGTLTKTGGTGDATITFSASDTNASWAHGLAFPAGINAIGSPLGSSPYQNINDPQIGLVPWYFQGAAGNTNISGDAGVQLVNQNVNPFSSGASLFEPIMNDDGTIEDPVGWAFSLSPRLRGAGEVPGCGSIVGNPDSTRMKGLTVDIGNAESVAFFDFINMKFRINKLVANVYQPLDATYSFTVSGVTVTPTGSNIYTNNGIRYTLNSSSISGGSGTLVFTGEGAPTSSGTLTQVAFNGAGAGDATITFSAVAKTGQWTDAFAVDDASGITSILQWGGTTTNQGIGTATPSTALEIYHPVSAGMGTMLYLHNGAGGSNAENGIESNTYDGASQPINAAVIFQDDGNFSNNILFQTKAQTSAGALSTKAQITSTGSLLLNNASMHAGQATCWTTSGQIGFCTSVVGAGGACTCTGL